jgi:hypothetical protein
MLETRHVFLDTSALVSLNFAYHGPVLSALASLAHQEAAFIYFTTVSVSEIKAQLQSEVHTSIQAASQFRKQARIFRNLTGSPYKEFFAELDPAHALAELTHQLEDFIAHSKVTVIPVNGIPVDEVFALYFNRKAPFGDSKKKNEFPDAFTLLALERWCQENNMTMYVVSQDNDLKTYCQYSSALLWLEKASDFVNLVTFHDEKLAPFVRDLLARNSTVLEEAIKQVFVDLGFFLDDQQGEVDEVTVTNVEITDEALIEVSEQHAVVELTATVAFEADVSYDDLATASYDSEDKVLIPWRTIRKTVEQEEEITVDVSLNLALDNQDLFDIDALEVDMDRRFGIGVTAEDDGWPYK